MEPDKSIDLEKYQKLFMGIILANFTHELRNHLSVVKELSGLQQDLIKIDQTVRDLPELVKTFESIDDQISHAIQLAGFLNRFAHRMDSEESFYSVIEVLDELMVLVHRLARQKMVTLQTDFAASVPRVVGSPANLQMLVFFLLDEKIRGLAPHSVIQIKVREEHGGVVVSIVSEEASLSAELSGRCPSNVLLAIARNMDAELMLDGDDERQIGILLRSAW
jgi:C4-dicarboxylate-specific signal transduction histidine kinase